jgi:outer membrane protein
MRSVVFLLVAGAAASVSAQERQAALSITLDQAIVRAAAASHRLADAAARRDQSEAAIEQNAASTRPQVTALAGYTRTSHVQPFRLTQPAGVFEIYPDLPDNYRARLDVQWPLYTGGRLEALTEAARKESSASGADFESLRTDVTLDVTRAFWTLVVADESARVIADSLTQMTAHVRDVQNQLDAGLVPPNDLLTAKARESRQRMLSIQAATGREVAEADLARLVGASYGTSIQPQADLVPVTGQQTAEALTALALAQRRDRQALVERLGAAESRQQAALAGRRPTIGIAGGVDVANPNPRIFPRQDAWHDFWDLGVNVSWALFDGGHTSADVAASAASTRALQARLDELDSQVALEIRQRLAEITSSRAAVESADASLNAATEASRVVSERFRAGVATSIEVLDAQQAVLQAALDRTQAIVSGRLAEARLRRATGQ